MKYLRTLLALLRAITYGWILALISLIRALCTRWRAQLWRARLPGRLGRIDRANCVKISDPAYKKPDPLIYDQRYLMSMGFAVTWDNPDIDLVQGGVVVPSLEVRPDTEYEIRARIWNGSTEAPIVGLPVRFSYVSFGMGATQHPIGTTTVNLGVKGGPGTPALATHPWRSPATPGHYCIQVDFYWSDDLNPKNNFGQKNLHVGEAHSPAQFELALANHTASRATYRFELDTYALPETPPCHSSRDGRRPGAITRLRSAQARHDRTAHPLPEGWAVRVDPAEPTLDGGSELTLSVNVDPPAEFRGRMPVNVHAFSEHGLAGGVTLYVERS